MDLWTGSTEGRAVGSRQSQAGAEDKCRARLRRLASRADHSLLWALPLTIGCPARQATTPAPAPARLAASASTSPAQASPASQHSCTRPPAASLCLAPRHAGLTGPDGPRPAARRCRHRRRRPGSAAAQPLAPLKGPLLPVCASPAALHARSLRAPPSAALLSPPRLALLPPALPSLLPHVAQRRLRPPLARHCPLLVQLGPAQCPAAQHSPPATATAARQATGMGRSAGWRAARRAVPRPAAGAPHLPAGRATASRAGRPHHPAT